jgi:5-methylcytosine-specific restriction protein A
MARMNWPASSRQSRGYGADWQAIRKRILERDNYLCQCRHCKTAGRTRLATEVDRAQGGTDDDANLQAISHDCHAIKTLEDEGKRSRDKVGFDRDGWPIWEKDGGVVKK